MARASKPCLTCPALVTDGASRCPACRTRLRRASRQRNGRSDSAYSTAAWRRQRAAKLKRDPLCEHTDERGSCGSPAEVVDHDPPRAQLVAARVHNPDHMRWLTSLCTSHHNAKTARIDGGFGRTPLHRNLQPVTQSDNPQG